MAIGLLLGRFYATFEFSGDGTQDVTITMVFLFHREAEQLIAAMAEDHQLQVTYLINIRWIRTGSQSCYPRKAVYNTMLYIDI